MMQMSSGHSDKRTMCFTHKKSWGAMMQGLAEKKKKKEIENVGSKMLAWN